MVKGDPDQRRRYLDDLLVATRPRFAGIRADYERVLRQRTALLKSARARGGVPGALDVWDEHLVEKGAELTAGRLELTAALRPLAAKAYAAVSGEDLAAAMTYSAFLSLFPLLAVATAITAAVLGDGGVQRVDEHIRKNLPNLGSDFTLDPVVKTAATVGVISAVILLWSGLSWVNTARGSMRAIWCVDDMPGNFAVRKLADLVSLVGLGLTLVVVAGSAVFALSRCQRRLIFQL